MRSSTSRNTYQSGGSVIYTKDCLSIQEISSRYYESMHLTLKLAKTLGSLKLKQTKRLICIGMLCYIVTCDGHDRIERWSRDLED
jgi:hypothetical protein